MFILLFNGFLEISMDAGINGIKFTLYIIEYCLIDLGMASGYLIAFILFLIMAKRKK